MSSNDEAAMRRRLRYCAGEGRIEWDGLRGTGGYLGNFSHATQLHFILSCDLASPDAKTQVRMGRRGFQATVR